MTPPRRMREELCYGSGMVSAAAISWSPSASAPDERFVLRGVPWHLYVTLRDTLDASGSKLHLTYLDGDLELMSPSPEHEEVKSLLAHLLEAWCVDQGIELFVRGSTTYREERAQRGLEPDESYSIGAYGERPDLAIEVVYSGWRVDKLEVYRGLGIGEVWVISRDRTVQVFTLHEGEYRESPRSAVLPQVELDVLARHAVPGVSLTAALRAFREELAR